MSKALPSVAFGSTLLDRGLESGGIDGIGQYCQELLSQYLKTPTEISVTPFSFGVTKSHCSAKLLPSYPRYLIHSLMNRNKQTSSEHVFQNADLIHATDQLIPINHGKPMVSTVMDTIPLSHPEYLRSSARFIKPWIWKKLTQRSDHIITISEFSKDEIANRMNFPREKISSIPLGVDNRYFERITDKAIQTTLEQFAIHTPFFLFVGSIQPRKNLITILKAHASLPNQLATQFPLVIAGKLAWNDGETLKAIHKGIEDKRCIWLNYVNDFEKRCLMQACLGVVFASLYEGFGLPIVEGFASSAPVITSNTTSMPEVAGDAALLVDPYQPDSIRSALITLIEQPSTRMALKEKGLIRSQAFHWDRVAKETLALYRTLI